MDGWSRPAAVTAGAVALAAVGLVAWARRSGVSVRAKLVTDVALPLSGMKRRARDAQGLRREIARHRRIEPARPSLWLRRKHRIRTDTLDGVEVITVSPRGGSSGITILYLHGGAWVFDVLGAHWRIVDGLIARTGARVIVPRYPLAPESTWRRTYAFLEHLLDTVGAEARDRLIVAGDSAGGCLALGIAQRLRARGEPLPAGLLLFSPALDLTFSDPGVRAIAPRDPMLAVPGCREAARLWAAGTPLADPRISPLFGSLAGLPPVAIVTGTRDLLHPDALRLSEGLARVGRAAALYRYPEQCHVFVGAPIPEAGRALDTASAFVRHCVGAPEAGPQRPVYPEAAAASFRRPNAVA
ncbi:alpha/beta hydrolase [Methylobacterium sp. NMS14P]|uniref:alpha/beta hydrolase n=1 Tax=Methylobacterium sp. NMS14P TaxID=2894310 RepID=UPI0023598A7C|nr:alpha/beta hydrolase [Methylobacterium sp. NMS14P]WCS25508.1 alpha/beta hydrolase [Methylobacterium sp. NMS14P]